MYVNETLRVKGEEGEAVYNEGLDFNYLSLYRDCFTGFIGLHPTYPRTFFHVAAAHDLYLALTASEIVKRKTVDIFKTRDFEYSLAWRQWQELGEVLAKDLAIDRGWRYSASSFDMSRLLGMRQKDMGRHDVDSMRTKYIDHAQFFRHPTKPYKPAAVLTHSYEPAENVELYAAAFGFDCEFLEYSWYYPRKCVAALLTPIAAKALRCR
jgi:hypothetical protein